MKIYYEYTEYEGFPKATEISRSRSHFQTTFTPFCLLGLIFSSISLLVSIFSEHEFILISSLATLVSAALYVYMIKFYPDITEKKIQKSIEESIKMKTVAKETMFHCKHIDVHYDKCILGTCNVCFEKNTPLKLCDIKKDSYSRSIYICDTCIGKFKSNQ